MKKNSNYLTSKLITFPKVSIPGIGPIFAAGIISEIGMIDCFKNDATLTKYAGLIWSDNFSSKVISENNQLFKSGNSNLKYYLLKSCNLFRIHNVEYSAFYSRK